MFYLTVQNENSKEHIVAKGMNFDTLRKFGKLFENDHSVRIYEADIHSFEIDKKTLEEKWQLVEEVK